MTTESGVNAPKGKYRIIEVDKFEPPGEHNVIGDYRSLKRALRKARNWTKKASKFSDSPDIATVYYVYNDKGEYLGGNIYKGE